VLLLLLCCCCAAVQRGYKVRALTRKPEKTQQLFNNHPNLEVSLHHVELLQDRHTIARPRLG
jgi:uncharacterized protein YbjT (DUF2867 family)